MATDFTNNNKTISASGGLQPTTRNTPLDVRTRVNLKADIDSIPNPFVGMKILVLQDETNGNQMTEYVVISLKADSLGIENAKINEVVLAKDFLGVNGNGITDEQAQQLNTAYTHSQTPHVQQSDIPTKTSELTNDSGFMTEVPSEYITEQELNAKGYLTEHQDISNKANKSDIPTKTSQLTNDSGFINSIPSEYVTESELSTELSTKANTTDIPSLDGYATETYVQNKIAEASLSGGQVDLSGYATKDELKTKANVSHTHTMSNITDLVIPDVNKAYVDTQLNTKANKSDIPNLDGYALKTDVPTKISDFTNDSGFLTSIPSEYITETELNNKGYLTEHQDISGKADKSEIPTKTSQLTNDSNFISSIPSEYITETELNAKGYLTEHQDISGKADKLYVDTELTKKSDKTHTHDQYLTEHQDISGKANISDLSAVATSGNYNDLTNKPTIPTKTSQLTNDSSFATESYVTNAINDASLGGGTVTASELTFSTLAEALSYGYSTNDVSKKVIVNDGKYIVTTTSSDWTLSTSTNNTYLSITNTDYVSYAMFGCPLNGTDDDTVGMQKAHAYSNANKVLLKNNSGTIYKADNTVIKVKWDMDLSGSTILVKNNNCEGMYQIVNDTETVYGYTKNVDKTYLRQGTCQFPMTDNSLPANCVIHMSDGNAWATRNDAGNIYTENRYELMFHHAFGICSGDLVADWSGDDTKLTFNYTKYNNRRLTVRGCRIRLESTSTIYCCLFDCRRHNTLITDMFIDTKPSAITAGSTSFKNAIIQIKDAYNTEISNITGTNIAGTESTRAGSGYVIRLINVYKCVLDNLNLNGIWGATGMNCVKDVTIQNTTINRIDVHSYFNDMNVRDTTVYDWGICLGYGSGSFTANNVKFINLQRPNMGGRCLIELNNTYGNLFTGDITLRDCEMITDGNDMSVIKLDFIGSNTPTRASVRMPNINIHNLKATNISSTEASLYMFNINGTSDFSSTQTKIGRANYFKFEDISFNNLSNVNQDIRFIWDSTTKDMYQTDVRTDIKIKNTNFNQTLPTDGLFAYINCGEYIPTLTIGNYTITYNETDDTLDFIYNGVIDEPVVPNIYVRDGLSMYIDAQDVTSYGSVRDLTGKQSIVNHGVSTTLDNGCLNFVASESDYIDCGFKPNLTKWSAEFYFYFTKIPTEAETVLGWGASGNRTAIAFWGTSFMIAINGNVEHTITSTAPTSLTHIVLTYNNGTIIAYVNGVKSQIATGANTMTSQAGNLMIGTKYSYTSEFANIHLKSLRFYDGKVLTDEEASQNYNYEINRG